MSSIHAFHGFFECDLSPTYVIKVEKIMYINIVSRAKTNSIKKFSIKYLLYKSVGQKIKSVIRLLIVLQLLDCISNKTIA